MNISDTSTAFTSIDAALAYAHENYRDDRIYTVKVPAGSYKLNGTLHIYGNTTLDVTDVKFQCIKESGNMLMLGKPSYNKNESVMGGYGTVKNMALILNLKAALFNREAAVTRWKLRLLMDLQ